MGAVTTTRNTVRLIAGRPWHFLLLQLPSATTEPLQQLLEHYAQNKTLLVAVLGVPYFVIATTISLCATFISVQHKGEKSLAYCFGQVFTRLHQLFVGSFLATAICVMAFAAFLLPCVYVLFLTLPKLAPFSQNIGYLLLAATGLILCACPGLYYSVLYFFVPLVIVSESPVPLTVYFCRAKHMAHAHLGRITFLLSLLMLFSFVQLGIVAGLAQLFDMSSPTAQTAYAILLVFVGAVLGAIIDVWVCSYYIQLRTRNEGA